MMAKANQVGALADEEDCFTLASAALVILFFSGILSRAPTAVEGNPGKLNFVFILTDDMRKDDLKSMPKIRSLLGDKGVQFEKAPRT